MGRFQAVTRAPGAISSGLGIHGDLAELSSTEGLSGSPADLLQNLRSVCTPSSKNYIHYGDLSSIRTEPTENKVIITS